MSLITLQQSLEAVAQRNGGYLTPSAVVAYAKPKSSPIHDRFTWDDKEAGEKFRLFEAACLIRSVRISYEKDNGEPSAPVRAWVNIREKNDEPGVYIPIQRALSSAETRDAILEDAKRDAEAFRKKYAGLQAAKKIVEAIGEFVEN